MAAVGDKNAQDLCLGLSFAHWSVCISEETVTHLSCWQIRVILSFDSRSMARRQRFLYDTPFQACIIVSVLNADKMRGFFFSFFGMQIRVAGGKGEGEEK